jgi:hypothetical protein
MCPIVRGSAFAFAARSQLPVPARENIQLSENHFFLAHFIELRDSSEVAGVE